MKKMSREKMIEAIENKKYLLMTSLSPFEENELEYYLTKIYADGSIKDGSWVEITKDRANEWIELGIEVLDM